VGSQKYTFLKDLWRGRGARGGTCDEPSEAKFWREKKIGICGRFGQVLTANNINNTKACQHLTTLRIFLNTKRTLGPKVNVIVLYWSLRASDGFPLAFDAFHPQGGAAVVS